MPTWCGNPNVLELLGSDAHDDALLLGRGSVVNCSTSTIEVNEQKTKKKRDRLCPLQVSASKDAADLIGRLAIADTASHPQRDAYSYAELTHFCAVIL